MIVRKGIADIWGSISDASQRRAIKVLVEGTPGVKKVYDHLTFEDELPSVT